MKFSRLRYLPILASGLVTLPVTFDITRRGSFFVTLLLVILMAAAGVGIGYRLGEIRTGVSAMVFALGVWLIEGYYYVSWYVAHGAGKDQTAGFAIAIAEGCIISLVGGISALVTCMLLQRN